MSNWWNKMSKMLSPRQDEYTKLKSALQDLEHRLDVAIKHGLLTHKMLENHKNVFKRIQEGRNHLSPNDVSRLQDRIINFLAHFKDYGFEEIPINTDQPQNCASIKPLVVVNSYGNWSKPSASKKCENLGMKTTTDQSRYENEPRRQSKRNIETPSVHQNLPKQIPPKLRGGYKPEDVEEQKQKPSVHQNLPTQILPKLIGGYKPEDVEEQKQKPSVHQNLPKQILPKLWSGGYKPEDVEEQKQKQNIDKSVNLHDVRDIEAQMMQRAQNEEEKNSNLQSTKQENRNTDDRIMTRQCTEQENTKTLRPCQRNKHAETRNISQITTRLQRRENQNRSYQSEYEENMRHGVTISQKRVQDENDRDDLGHFRRQEEVANRRCCSDEKYVQIPQEHVEPQDCQAITTNLKLDTQYQQDRNDYKPQYDKEKEKRRRWNDSKEHVEQQNICHGVITRHLQHLQDQNQYKHQDNEKKALEKENRRSYNDSVEYTEHQNIHHGVTTRQKDIQYLQEQYYDKNPGEESRGSYNDSKHYAPKQNICHGVTTRQEQMQYLQSQNEYKRQNNEASEEINRGSYNVPGRQNIHHGVATKQNQQTQYYDEETKRNYNDSKDYTQKLDICHEVTARQKQMQHQQAQNEYKRQNNEEKALEEKSRIIYNVTKDYTGRQNIHHGVATRQNQQQQDYNEKLIEEENRRRYGHPEKKLEAQGVTTRRNHIDPTRYMEENRIYNENNENYDKKHKPKSGGDSHLTTPYSEEYYIQAAREDGTYDRYREAAVQTCPHHQVRGRGRTYNLPSNYQHVEIETAQEVEEPLEILDVHQYFQDDFDLKTLDSSIDTLTQIETVEKWSRTFEDKVNNFSEAKFSLEYFVIDEKLMRMIEHLDKLKCKDDSESTKRKIQVIEYIKDLQTTLDKRAIDD